MMDKLKPCPFCGGKAAVMYASCEGETTVAVVCQTCHIAKKILEENV